MISRETAKTGPQAKACEPAVKRWISLLLIPQQITLLVVRWRAIRLPPLPSVESARSVGSAKSDVKDETSETSESETSPDGRARYAGGRSDRADAVHCVQAPCWRPRDASEMSYPWSPCDLACQDLADYSLRNSIALFARLETQQRGRSLVLAWPCAPPSLPRVGGPRRGLFFLSGQPNAEILPNAPPSRRRVCSLILDSIMRLIRRGKPFSMSMKTIIYQLCFVSAHFFSDAHEAASIRSTVSDRFEALLVDVVIAKSS
jgi:hypothetical protein